MIIEMIRPIGMIILVILGLSKAGAGGGDRRVLPTDPGQAHGGLRAEGFKVSM